MKIIITTALFAVSILNHLLAYSDSVVQSDKLIVSKIYTDESQATHFSDEVIDWSPFATPDGELAVTQLLPANRIGFLQIPKSYRSGWHNAPKKQYVMVLKGLVEVEVSDGEKRVFSPGSVTLVTDVDGVGHRTRAVGDEDVLLVWVPVP